MPAMSAVDIERSAFGKGRDKSGTWPQFYAAALEHFDGTLHLGLFDADVELGKIPDTDRLSTGEEAEPWRRRTS
jgi:hypothetical protein